MRGSGLASPRLALLAGVAALALGPPAFGLVGSDSGGGDDEMAPPQELSVDEVLWLRDEARAMFTHGFDSYRKHADGTDELMPLSCRGRHHEDRKRGTLDDSLGGFALTLVDSLDALALQGNFTAFAEAIYEVRDSVRFDNNVYVSVFETNIRVLGGLLAAHQLAERFRDRLRDRDGRLLGYDGFLLRQAQDLGSRLLPAFNTPTGIPFHRINLRTRSAAPREKRHTCTAAAGSLLVEMGLLSRLTGDSRFEEKAQRAVDALWERRSDIQLVGSLIDVDTGKWMTSHTGAGAGVDSFHEYLHKAAVLLKNDDLGVAFNESYAAVQKHCAWRPSATMRRNFRRAGAVNQTEERWYQTLNQGLSEYLIEVDMHKGYRAPYGATVSALQAFWPGLQVMAGHVLEAEKSYADLLALWGRYRALPDLFDLVAQNGEGSLLKYGRDSPLRPELIESTYHLHRATGKPVYLSAAKEMLYAIQNTSRVDCGYAAIADVRSGRLDDRMDSFVLSETFKYLFLIFDGALPPALQTSILCPSGGGGGLRRRAVPQAPLAPRPGFLGALQRKLSTAKAVVDSSGDIDADGGGGGDAVDGDCLSEEEFIFSTEGHLLLIP